MNAKDMQRKVEKVKTLIEELLEECPDYVDVVAFETLEEAYRQVDVVADLIAKHSEDE